MKLSIPLVEHCVTSRPPRGGRGLKLEELAQLAIHGLVAPHAGGVD